MEEVISVYKSLSNILEKKKTQVEKVVGKKKSCRKRQAEKY